MTKILLKETFQTMCLSQLNETHTHTGLTSLVHDGLQRLQCQLVGDVQVIG